jgi:hypothetical protein
MRKFIAAAIAAMGLVLAVSEAADAATAGGGGGRGGGFAGGMRGGGGFRGGEGFRGGFRGDGFRGGFRGGIFVGPGFGWYDPFWWPYDPYYYPFAYPYLPREAIGQYAPPPGYLPEAAGAPAQQYWYRCGNPEGYYPYVRACNGGWEQVPVAPSGAPGVPGEPTAPHTR